MKAAYQHNGQTISAEAFYAIACDPRRSVAVEACAGAGKTWMLVSRIVRALLDGAQPQEILAITFTKRAASEMRERLYQWLTDFSTADAATLAQELQMRGVSGQIAPRSPSNIDSLLSNLYKSILTTGRQVQIRTFHSWFASLLRTAPLSVLQQLALPASYELLEDDAPAKALVWRRFYAALLNSPAHQADFEAVVFQHGRFQSEKALQVALDKRVEFALADATGAVDASVLPFAQQVPAFADVTEPTQFLTDIPAHWQLLLAAAKALGGASAPTFSAKGVELEMALTEFDLDGLRLALLTEKGTPRKFSEKVNGLATVRAAQDVVLQVLAAQNQHSAYVHQQRMARLTRVLIEEFAAVKRDNGWVDMNDVERAAAVMLGDPVLSGWVQQRLDARIKHLLIDEFQDTNPLQWQALHAWLSSYAGAGGGGAPPSVFSVGDPKQSIYRFRRAEPQVFKAAQAFVRDGLSGALLSCDHTRRNATGVIAAVNAVMGEALTNDGYDGFRDHTTSSSDEGTVCQLPPILRGPQEGSEEGNDGGTSDGEWRDSLTTPQSLPEETLRTLEARQAAQWIAQLIAGGSRGAGGLTPKDVMVLSRKRAGLGPLQDELRGLNIAAQIGEKTKLIDCCEVQDIVALLDLLVSPQHDLSLARVMKSPLFSLPDTALVELALLKQTYPKDTPVSWFDLLQKPELKTPILRGLGATLLQWKRLVDTLPPHDALQAIYSEGDVLARFAITAPLTQREAVLANLRALLGVALQLGGGRFATPYGLVRALKAGGVLAPAAVVPNAVRLLTIHGAKGLEADAVLLLDTDTTPRPADTMGVLVDWPGEAPSPVKFVFLASESNPPACAVDTLAAEVVERQREELNALYVAITRARHTLAVSSIAPFRAPANSWWQRLSKVAVPAPALEGDWVEPSNTPLAAFSIQIMPEVPVEYQLFAIKKEVILKVNTPDGDDTSQSANTPDTAATRFGKAVHRLLEWTDGSATTSTNSSATSIDTRAVAREFGLTPVDATAAAAMAQRILHGEGSWAWDSAVVKWQGNEVPLVYQGQTLCIDRLVQRQDTGTWWVLDYKSPRAPQQDPVLVAQLQNYVQAVQAIYPGEPVKAAFLTGQGALIPI